MNTLLLTKRRGFTLVEVLVVLAIIAILAATVMISLETVREKSRDTRRMRDLQELQKALALYASNNSVYPIATSPVDITGTDVMSTALVSDNDTQAVLPDPLSPVQDYTYQTDASGSTYQITFCLETDTIPNYNSGCGNTLSP